ncbi:MAG: heparan-alpha-glucosaminide N-acetyltransferase domain-containing protein, partial [Acidimicrobiales bacterium]
MASDGVPAGRSRGLDVMRGAAVAFLLVITFTPGTGWNEHANWWGWRAADAFFPAFLLVAGVGLGYQTGRAVPWSRLLRRFALLILVGLVLNAVLGAGTDLGRLRIPGVLQRIAVVGLLGAAFVAVTRRRYEAAVAGAVGVALVWAVVVWLAASSCPGHRPTPAGCGTLFDLDEAVFGHAHLYRDGGQGHDPEGLASTLGALATFLAGFGAGAALVARPAEPLIRRVRPVVVMAAGWLAVTPVFLAFQPVGKRMWTASLVSVTAAGGLALLVGAMALFDAEWRHRWARRSVQVVAWPLEALGRNAL